MPEGSGLIPPHGGFRELRSFQNARFVYDATVVFCDRFVDKRSRTHDQMVQAARSGPQNIAEGSLASGTSKKTEIKLTGVAHATLGELILDYEDFLRQRGFPMWGKDSAESHAVRAKYRAIPAYKSDSDDWAEPSDPQILVTSLDAYGLRTASADVAANTLICLANQASYLIWRQLKALKKAFLEEGGFTERLYRERKRHRDHP
jgi:restriction system protein